MENLSGKHCRHSVIAMLSLEAVLFSLLIAAASCSEDLEFPPGFMFGAASASFQIEGSWNVSGKTPSIWDKVIHDDPDIVDDGSNADVASDSYHLWRRDIEMASELGLHFYRFSLSWPRILPNGIANKISEEGLSYYSNLIDGLLEKGIQPLVTLYHWDLPQSLQDLGGWTNPLIVDWFGEYARVVFTHFADRVKMWLTINEPIVLCRVYSSGTSPPGIYSPEIGTYLCHRHLLLAHAKAWRIFDKEFRPKYYGELAPAYLYIWKEPLSPEYEELTAISREFSGCMFSHPIYSKEGDWPPIAKKIIAERSKAKGYSRSYLPEFTQEEIEFIRGTFDFYGLNYYSSRLVRRAEEGEFLHPWDDAPDIEAKFVVHPDWKSTILNWIYINPSGLRRQLLWLREQYGDIKFMITENGYPSTTGLEDTDRIEYFRAHLKQILLAIKEDGINVTGYTAWSLMDCFEWTNGYTIKFGLYEVDFSSSNRTRTPRASAKFYKNVIQKHSLNV